MIYERTLYHSQYSHSSMSRKRARIVDYCEQNVLFSKEWMNRYDMRVWTVLFGADLEPVTDHLNTI